VHQPLTLHEAANAAEVVSLSHIHVGRIDGSLRWRTLFGILFSSTLNVDAFDAQMNGEWRSVAMRANHAPDLFLLTINKGFVLLTMKNGGKRTPIIHKRWRRRDRKAPTAYLAQISPSEDTYEDTDGLKWIHSYGGYIGNELVAFDANDAESIRLTLTLT